MQNKMLAAALSLLLSADVQPAGKEQMPLPLDLHIKNTGGSDGAGLCVFASITHSAHWQNEHDLQKLFAWMKSKPGGGYPSKVDKMIDQMTGGKIKVIQYEGNDLDVLRLAVRTGRMPAVTYSVSPSGRYGGRKIAHMVSLVGISGSGASETWEILDNNYPGTVERLSTSEFQRSFSLGGGGWAVILYPPGRPPEPRN